MLRNWKTKLFPQTHIRVEHNLLPFGLIQGCQQSLNKFWDVFAPSGCPFLRANSLSNKIVTKVCLAMKVPIISCSSVHPSLLCWHLKYSKKSGDNLISWRTLIIQLQGKNETDFLYISARNYGWKGYFAYIYSRDVFFSCSFATTSSWDIYSCEKTFYNFLWDFWKGWLALTGDKANFE